MYNIPVKLGLNPQKKAQRITDHDMNVLYDVRGFSFIGLTFAFPCTVF